MSYNKIKKQATKLTPFLLKNFYWSNKSFGQINFSEAKGRDWRFRSFARLYFSQKYNIIITGHTATDQAETALLQLIRGTRFYGMTRFQFSKKYKGIFPRYPNYSVFFTFFC